MYMSQLNVNLDQATEENLRQLMRLRAIRTKSDAVRVALAEAVERATLGRTTVKYAEWLRLGTRVPLNPSARFAGHDDLWGAS